MEASNAVARNWQEFPRNDENKRQLFSILRLQTSTLETEGQIITTHLISVLNQGMLLVLLPALTRRLTLGSSYIS